MMKPSSFEVIRSHIQYGHNVFAKNEKTGECRRFWHVKYDSDGSACLISDDPHLWTESAVNRFGFTSITPIPHRYKKLEVGAKVDVLQSFNPVMCHREWRVHSNLGEVVYIETLEKDWEKAVPLWAITPHVEGEEIGRASDGITGELINRLNIELRGNEIRVPELLDVAGRVNEVIEVVNELIARQNLQGTNN